jgi:hypothetical protein
MRTLRASLVVSTIMLSTATSSQAALIAYEGFDYTEADGTSVGGLNGGTGWDEAYPTPNPAGITLRSGLSRVGITSVGKAMQYSASATLTANGRNWEAAVPAGASTYYYSFLINPITNGSGGYSRGTFGLLQNGSGSDNQNGYGIRYDNSGTSLIINAQSSAQAPGTNINFGPTGWGDTYLVVGKLDVNSSGTTTNSIWVYPSSATLPTSEAGLGVAMSSVTGSTGTVFPAMYGRAFGGTQLTGFDEIRIGTTAGDVGIPEPTALFATVAAAGVALRRRRR